MLDANQLARVNFPFDDVSRNTWHYLPATSWPRTGLPLKELNDSQHNEFLKFLMSNLSQKGYEKTQKIIDLENVLAEIENDTIRRNPKNYYIAIYGNPKTDSLWAWSFEGHHISLNFTILNNQITTTPRFLGANPATIPSGKRKGERTLEKEEDLGFDLINSMTAEQKQKAVFQSESYYEIVTKNNAEAQPLEAVGINSKALNSEQKTILKSIIDEYLSSLPIGIAQMRANKIFAEEFDAISFGWAGATKIGVGHYYRVQGKSFLIEFDNTQNNANHIHTVWRDFDSDFGKDLIKEHYLHAEHHKHN